jgi:hypothetical protein
MLVIFLRETHQPFMLGLVTLLKEQSKLVVSCYIGFSRLVAYLENLTSCLSNKLFTKGLNICSLLFVPSCRKDKVFNDKSSSLLQVIY